MTGRFEMLGASDVEVCEGGVCSVPAQAEAEVSAEAPPR